MNSLPLAQKNQALGDWLLAHGPLVVAFSGGVDSGFLWARARQVLGNRAPACLVKGPSLPAWDLASAQEFAQGLNAPLEVIPVSAEAAPEIWVNNPDRCHHCKTLNYQVIQDRAKAQGWGQIVDGTNLDDHADYRPGLKAAALAGVASPLALVGLSKNEIRHLAREMGLSLWDKPSSPCLNSRVPYGQAITPQKLSQIEQGEAWLLAKGFRGFRLRHHGEIARLELAESDLAQALAQRAEINQFIKSLGFAFVTLDLGGYSPGPFNPKTP